MNQIPKCGAVRTGDHITLVGFDAVDAWAKDNDGVWNTITRLATIHQWDEIDRLRLIASTFMHERARMKQEIKDELTSPEVWIEIGIEPSAPAARVSTVA